MSWLNDAEVKTAEHKQAEYEAGVLSRLTSAVQSHLDETARQRNYDHMLSLCTYATSVNPKFAAEGQAGVAWRDAVWAQSYELMEEVMSGQREVPETQELIAMLPAFEWPAV